MKQTVQEALEILATDNEKRVAFGLPAAIKVGKNDVLAARILLWLEEQDENQTVGDVIDILNAAQWWHTLFSSIYREEETK